MVSNYDDSYLGSIDLERATIESDNAVYAQLTQLVGSKHVAETARRMGIRSKLDGYFAIGLGAEAVNPLELARAYATLAYGGRRVDGAMFGNKPRVIEKVTERGRTRFNAPTKFDALTATEAGIMNAILQKAVRLGTGKRAALVDRPVAGKTGTTENYGDAWFVGYTPQLVVAVWVGYPTTLKPMLTEFNGKAVTGGSFPALIWKTFVEKALKGVPPEGFPYPSTPYVAPKLVVRRGDRLLLDNGLCRSRQEVVYFAGKGPSQTANCLVNEVEVPDVRKLTLAEAQARVAAQPLTAELVYKPAAPLQEPGHRRRPAAEGRLSILLRPDHPRGLEGDPGRDPEPRRPESRRRTPAAEEAEDRAEDQLGDREARHDPPAEATRRPRGGARA